MAVILITGHLPALSATNYGIRIGGVEVTSDNYSNISGSASNISGTVKYDPNTCTLTLQNANINANNTNGMHFYGAFYYGLKVKLVGTNKITNINGIGLGIHITQSSTTDSKNVTFQGTGSLEIPGCIDVYTYCPYLTFTETCTVKATYCYSEISSSLYVEQGSTLHLTQGSSYGTLRGFTNVYLNNDTEVTIPEGGSYDSSNKYLKDSSGSKVTGEAKLGVVDYKITVGGVKVTSWNKNSITGSTISGTINYIKSLNRLTLNNATINYSSGYGIHTENNGLEIYLAGTNTISGTFPLDINADTNIWTSSSSVSLTLNASSSPIYVGKDSKLAIKNITLTTNGSTSSGAIRGYGSNSTLEFTGATVTINAGSNPCVKNITACTFYSDEITTPTQVCYRSSKKWIGTTSAATTGTLKIQKPSTTYGIVIARHLLNDLNANNFCYENISGTITYNYANNKVSLNNVTADCEDDTAFRILSGTKDEDFTISVTGTNTFSGNNPHIYYVEDYISRKLIIEGQGTLNVESIRLFGSLEIRNCTLNAKFLRNISGTTYICSIYDAIVNLSGNATDGTIHGFKYFNLYGVEILSPEGAKYSNADLYLSDSSGNKVKGAVSIGVKEYDVWVAGVRVTSANADGITGSYISGSVKYSAEYNRLELEDASLTYTSSYGIWNNTGEQLTVDLRGSNTIKGTHAIFSNGNLLLSGNISNFPTLALKGSISGVLINGPYEFCVFCVNMTAEGATSSGCIRGDGNSKLELAGCNVTINAGSYPCVKGFSNGWQLLDEVTSPKKVWFNPSLTGYGTATALTTGTLVIQRPELDYDFAVAGHQLNELNADNFYYDNTSGTLTYDHSTETLTLTNFTGDCKNENRGISADGANNIENLTIHLNGTNQLINTRTYGLSLENIKASFTGSNASLITDGPILLGKDAGWNGYSIEGVTLEGTNIISFATGTDSSPYPYFSIGDGSKLRLTGSNEGTVESVILNNSYFYDYSYGEQCHHFTTPNGAWIDGLNGTVRTSPFAGNEVVTGELVYEQVADYRMMLAGVEVTSANKSDILAGMGISGKATYNTGTKVLTLSGINIPAPAGDGLGNYALETWSTVPNNFSVLVKNTNNFINCGGEMSFSKSTTINSSNGTLKAVGIRAFNLDTPVNLTINDLIFRGEYLWGVDGTCTINSCDIELSGNSSGTLRGFETVTGPGLIYTTPAGAVYTDKCLKKNGQMVTGKVVIGFEQGPPTAIDGIEEGQPQVETVYDTAGRQLNDTRKGMNLVRMSDGTVRKQVRRK